MTPKRTELATYADLLAQRARPTERRLPTTDPAIDAMDPALRHAVGATWQRRAHEELKASMTFALLSRKLLEIGAAPEAMSRVARAVGDEVRHAEVCRALASRYLGEEVPWPAAVHAELGPTDDDPRVQASLHTVALSCVNETIAGVFIEASHAACVCPSARATLGIILADEVEHGRAGWAFLASVRTDRIVMRAVQRNLAAIVGEIAACWFDDTPVTLPAGAPEHGLPSNQDTHRCVVTALREIVLPGFTQLGLDVAEAASRIDALVG